MVTSKDVVSIACGELGVKEYPPNSNNVKYNTWFYGHKVSGSSYPWCMAFVQWCCSKADVQLPLKTASCGKLMDAAKKSGHWVSKNFCPGDVVIYDFPGGAATDHCGIIESVSGASIVAIEGNTSISGSQSNGGMVCRKTRPLSQVVGAVRPKYKEDKPMNNTPSPAHKDGVEWALKLGILKGRSDGSLMLNEPLTREQFCTMLMRYDAQRKNV